jgi:single-stranded-DNA-specific exonuclease
MRKVWRVGSGLEPVATVDALQRLLFVSRGLDVEKSQTFFEPRYDSDVHDPYLLHGMKVAVDRVFEAIERKEKILVHGDYDADGISATAIMVTVLRDLGAHVVPYLPHRSNEGYGLNLATIQKLAAEFDLFITVDCGISNAEEIGWLKTQNKEVIVVDHHELPEILPAAMAILHPRHPEGHYPFGYVCGAGVAWKFAQALSRDERGTLHNNPDYEKWLLDFALLGTLADAVPLIDENRAIVRFGLQVLQRSRRPGIQALLPRGNRYGRNVNAQDVAYQMIPRLNAAGRIDHAQPALDLLLASTQEQAIKMLVRLNKYNSERQSITRQVMAEAEAQITPQDQFIFVVNPNWPAGVVGLAAGRLSERFARPAIVIGSNGRHAVGSARAPQGANVLTLLQRGEAHLLKLGGHAQAAGFSIAPEKVSAFHTTLQETFTQENLEQLAESPVQAEALLAHDLLHWDTVELLERFQPFGQGNPEPLFIATRLALADVRSVGKKQEHAKFTFEIEHELIDGIGFGLFGELNSRMGKYVDAAFYVTADDFRGRSCVQLKIQDIARAGTIEIQKRKHG